MNPAHDIMTWYKQIVPTKCVTAQVPTEPDEIIIFTDTAGRAPSNTHDGKGGYRYPGLQVRVRGKPGDYFTPQALINQAYALLHLRRNLYINGTLYQLIEAQQSNGLYIGTDQSNRHEFTLNFIITV